VKRRVRLIGAGLLAVVVLLVLVAAGCGSDSSSSESGSSTSGGSAASVDGTSVTVADKGFTESQIIAQLYAQALEAVGYKASVKSLGSADIADAAVRKGDIDLYPEYTGTAYNVILKKTDVPSPKAEYAAVKAAYAGRGLTTLTPSPYSNDNRVACTKDAVDKYHLQTLTDLGKASPNLVYSANPEHLTRADGLPLLKSAYGVHFKDIKTVALNLRYKPIEDGQAQCVYAFGTDPQIAKDGLVVLKDDLGKFQGLAYENFPVINTTFFAAQPPVFRQTIDKVDAALTQEAVQKLNASVDLNKEDPSDVAKDFLDQNSLD
jgi:osmoprotectant transport system substrate-binding protein